jgi:hypothetical protein
VTPMKDLDAIPRLPDLDAHGGAVLWATVRLMLII